MARIDVRNGYEFDFLKLDLNILYYGTSYQRYSTVFQVSYGYDSSDTFRGYGFSYSFNGEPTGGVVTSYKAILFGSTAYSVTGISISATKLVAAARTISTSDDMTLLKSALAGADVFNGSYGSDSFKSYGGNDRLNGRAGDDRLNGGSGDDLIIGDTGQDTLTGGYGRDKFRFNKASDSAEWASDIIRDFRRGADKIDLSRIDAQSGLGNQAFKFIGASGFTGKAGELRFASGSVSGDVNGDGLADFAIRVAKVSGLSASDFVL